jgi:hypothetical protein
MKKLYLLLTILLTILIIKGCSDSTTEPPPGNNGDDGLLEGAVYYNGTYPLPSEILYYINGIPFIVQGYAGQSGNCTW